MDLDFLILLLYTSWIYLVSVIQEVAASGDSGNPIVDTVEGRVKGIKRYIHGKPLNIFYGIPFAKPPIGENRFRPPQPNDPWKGIYNATRLPNSCVQGYDTVFVNFSGAEVWNPNTTPDEDCLYLNVWVPRTHPPFREKAVMVWIYGGGFYSGSSVLDIYDASYLAVENDVIVVSMQYRVGALGFLYLNINEARGNAGMLDQVMALNWIQRNIKAFGGSPNNVTLFGESAGAVSVGLHLLSPLSQGKFARAILESGAPHLAWSTIPEKEAIARARVFAKSMGCRHADHTDIVRCLKQKPASAFPMHEAFYGLLQVQFVPVVDGNFLLENPIQSVLRHKFKKTEILLGNNANEGTYFLVYQEPDYFPLENDECRISKFQFEMLIDRLFESYPQYPHKMNSFGKDALLFQYTPWKDPDNQIENRKMIDRAIGDFHFVCGLLHLAETYAEAGENVYYYSFEHRSTQHFWPEWMGVLHADEINFVFGEPLRPDMNYNHMEKKLSRKIMKYWTNFAKTGNPNKGTDEISTDEWPRFTVERKEFLRLDTMYLHHSEKPMAIGSGDRTKECAFWREYVPRLVSATADISEVEKEWKLEFHEWKSKYIVDWKHQFNNFIDNHQKRLQSCATGP